MAESSTSLAANANEGNFHARLSNRMSGALEGYGFKSYQMGFSWA